MDYRLNPSLPHKKGEHETAKNHSAIARTAIATNIYKSFPLNCTRQEVEKILCKNQNSFCWNRSTTFWLSIKIKSAKATILISSRHSILYRVKMGQIQLTNRHSKETVTTKMMLYKNTKVMVRSTNGDTNLFGIVTSVAKSCISSVYIYNMPKLQTSNINRSNKRKWFHTIKRQEAEKLWQTQATQMISYFLQIHLPTPIPYCIAWSKQQEILASTWTQIK